MNELLFGIHLLSLLGMMTLISVFRVQLLEAVFIFCCVAANVFVLKQINLFGLQVTAADVYSVGAMLSVNLLQEFSPKSSINNLIQMGFIVMLLFAVNSWFHLLYVPGLHDYSQEAYQMLFHHTPRLVIVSMVCFLFSTWVEASLFKRLSATSLPFYCRAMVSMMVGQTLDTGLFTVLALYNILDSLLTIFFFSLSIKFLTIAASTPALSLMKRLRIRYV
ncbi:MAG TPA: queuosine precursor transporter [Gammaproteobacteria bacterium]|nr:queuosine precursor transporter [Gammaproteobacteria bacterium]